MILAKEATVRAFDLLEFIMIVIHSDTELLKLFVSKNTDLLQEEGNKLKENYHKVQKNII